MDGTGYKMPSWISSSGEAVIYIACRLVNAGHSLALFYSASRSKSKYFEIDFGQDWLLTMRAFSHIAFSALLATTTEAFSSRGMACLGASFGSS